MGASQSDAISAQIVANGADSHAIGDDRKHGDGAYEKNMHCSYAPPFIKCLVLFIAGSAALLPLSAPIQAQETQQRIIKAKMMAVACKDLERLKYISEFCAHDDAPRLMKEISKAKVEGECQYIFKGNKLSVFELSQPFSKILNPGNDKLWVYSR